MRVIVCLFISYFLLCLHVCVRSRTTKRRFEFVSRNSQAMTNIRMLRTEKLCEITCLVGKLDSSQQAKLTPSDVKLLL